METDITSIIIAILALSIFFVPIGLYQYSEKQKIKNTKKIFDNAAKKYGLKANDLQVLRNKMAIGIDLENHALLHVNHNNETLLDIRNIENCKLYKVQKTLPSEDGLSRTYVEMGICVMLRKGKKHKVKLPFYLDKEGNFFGDENPAIQNWISKINSQSTKRPA